MDVSQNHAGSKAPDDIAHILDELNYKRLNIQYRTRSSFFQKLIDYLRVYFSISFVSKTIKTNSVLFIQYPFPFKDFVFKKLMQVLYLLKKKAARTGCLQPRLQPALQPPDDGYEVCLLR